MVRGRHLDLGLVRVQQHAVEVRQGLFVLVVEVRRALARHYRQDAGDRHNRERTVVLHPCRRLVRCQESLDGLAEILIRPAAFAHLRGPANHAERRENSRIGVAVRELIRRPRAHQRVGQIGKAGLDVGAERRGSEEKDQGSYEPANRSLTVAARKRRVPIPSRDREGAVPETKIEFLPHNLPPAYLSRTLNEIHYCIARLPLVSISP